MRTLPTVRRKGDPRYLGFEHLIPDEPFPKWIKDLVSVFSLPVQQLTGLQSKSTTVLRVGPISKEKPNDIWALGMTILHASMRSIFCALLIDPECSSTLTAGRGMRLELTMK